MNICFMAPIGSAHIVKWCNWFTEHGNEVHAIFFTPGNVIESPVHQNDIGVVPGR